MGVTILKWWSTQGIERIVEFDAVEMEAPTFESTITEYPIETGANLVDHIRLRPVQLRITAVVTNNPSRDSVRRHWSMDGIKPKALQPIVVSEALGAGSNNPAGRWGYTLPNSVGGYSLNREKRYDAKGAWYTRADSVQRVTNVYQDLQAALEQAREFTVVSDTLGEFNQMLIRSVRTERDARAGNSLRLQIEMQQLRYATLVRRNVAGRLPKPKAKASKPKVKTGNKPVTQADRESTLRAETEHTSAANRARIWLTEQARGGQTTDVLPP